MQLQFLASVELFFNAVELLQFLTRAELIFFFDIQFFPLCGLSCLHLYLECSIQPLSKVKGLEQYTSWKVRVPDRFFFFVRNEQNE